MEMKKQLKWRNHIFRLCHRDKTSNNTPIPLILPMHTTLYHMWKLWCYTINLSRWILSVVWGGLVHCKRTPVLSLSAVPKGSGGWAAPTWKGGACTRTHRWIQNGKQVPVLGWDKSHDMERRWLCQDTLEAPYPTPYEDRNCDRIAQINSILLSKSHHLTIKQ
jgi:hypothetical protein